MCSNIYPTGKEDILKQINLYMKHLSQFSFNTKSKLYLKLITEQRRYHEFNTQGNAASQQLVFTISKRKLT